MGEGPLCNPGLCLRQWDMTREKRDPLVDYLIYLLLGTVGVAAARSGWSGVVVLCDVIALGLGALGRRMPGILVHHPAHAVVPRCSDG